MIRGWLVINGFLRSEKFDELIRYFKAAAEKKAIELRVVKNDCLLVDTACIPKERPDFVIFWDKDVLLAEYLEDIGLPVFNSGRCIAVCDDKRKTHLALLKNNIPAPRTIFAPMTYSNVGFTGLDFIEEAEKRLGYPMVVKEAFGSFGEQVYLAENRGQLTERIRQCETTELLFQEYVSESRGRDVRIQVVGGEAVCAMYRHSDSDFRANITNGGSMREYRPDDRETELAIRAAEAVGADFAGVDLLFGAGGPVVCEVNSNAHFKNLMDCTGVNTAEGIVELAVRSSLHGKNSARTYFPGK